MDGIMGKRIGQLFFIRLIKVHNLLKILVNKYKCLQGVTQMFRTWDSNWEVSVYGGGWGWYNNLKCIEGDTPLVEIWDFSLKVSG